MIVTEEEAKKLWCPANANRLVSQPKAMCIGSKCMLWNELYKETKQGDKITPAKGCCGKVGL